MRNLNRLCALVGGALVAADVSAQALEEIIVTARMREEPLADVPVSVSVVTDEWIEGYAVRSFEELAYSVPNFTVNETPIDTNIFIRGVGSPENQGFEQSVGLFSDGIYWGRARQARAPFFDVERIEVLKGPQGIIFGKNTSAGAVSITTARPTPDAGGYVSAMYEPEAEELVVAGVLNGALSDTLSGRLAVRSASMDGWVRNTAVAGDEPVRDELFLRGSLLWDPHDDLNLYFKYEYGELDVEGSGMQVTEPGVFGGLFSLFDPAFEAGLDESRSVGGSGLFVAPETSDTDTHNAALTVEWDLDGYTLTSITGYSEYSFDDAFDADISALSQAQKLFGSDFSQWSQELRLFSPLADTGGIDYVAGLYWQDSELDVVTRDDIDLTLLMAPAGSRYYVTSQASRVLGAFAQATWYASDDLRVTAGARLVDEDKSARRSLVVTDLGTTTPNPALEPFFGAALGTFPHSLAGSRSETQFLPALSLQWDLGRATMLYASWSKGYKGGGFDEQLTSGSPDDWEFEEEEVDAWELGAKAVFAEQRANLNVALFRNEFSDLQVSAFDGLAGFVVGNAAAATSFGLEVDGQLRFGDSGRTGLSIALLDAEYDRFENAACTAAQTAAHDAANLPPPCVQDLSGRKLMYAPEWAGNLFVENAFALPGDAGLELHARIDVNVSDAFFITQDLDANLEQDAFAKLNLRLALQPADGDWSLALIGKNLTDEQTASFGNDVPILSGAFFKFADRTRSIALKGTYRF